MTRRIPTRAEPSGDELERYVEDMLATMIRLAWDAGMPDLAERIRLAKAHVEKKPAETTPLPLSRSAGPPARRG